MKIFTCSLSSATKDGLDDGDFFEANVIAESIYEPIGLYLPSIVSFFCLLLSLSFSLSLSLSLSGHPHLWKFSCVLIVQTTMRYTSSACLRQIRVTVRPNQRVLFDIFNVEVHDACSVDAIGHTDIL
jgi:hypothetical protein